MTRIFAIFAVVLLAGCAPQTPADFLAKYPAPAEMPDPAGLNAKNLRVFPGGIALFDTRDSWATHETVAWDGPSGDFLEFYFWFRGRMADGGFLDPEPCAATPGCTPIFELHFGEKTSGDLVPMGTKIDLPGPEVWPDEKILEFFKNARAR